MDNLNVSDSSRSYPFYHAALNIFPYHFFYYHIFFHHISGHRIFYCHISCYGQVYACGQTDHHRSFSHDLEEVYSDSQ